MKPANFVSRAETPSPLASRPSPLLHLFLALCAHALLAGAAPTNAPPLPAGLRQVSPQVRTVDLNQGDELDLVLSDGTSARLKLISLEETADSLRQAVRQARVVVQLNGTSLTLTSATYHLPVTMGGVQIDCPITRGYTRNSRENVWALDKDARFRLWPAGAPWMEPGTFGYPVRQRWFASDTQMANEPTFVDGGEKPDAKAIYYHWGLDFGGAEGLIEVAAATDGLVVSAAGQTLPAYTNSPAKPRYDVIYVLDGRGWYYRYSHLLTIEVKPGQIVRLGQRLGLLGKEGGSGGWSHLHFDITSLQPSGRWGIQDAYAYAWEAYRADCAPKLLAVARPHRLVATGEKVLLDGSRSWSAAGPLARFTWQFSDGSTATGPAVERTYTRPGSYSEVLTVTDASGATAVDFAVVQVIDPARTTELPPTLHPAFSPTRHLRPGDPVTFKVRSFRTTPGQEWWDFGDGTPPVAVRSDANAQVHAKDGYAVTEHRYAKPGRYLVRVEHANPRGQKAAAHLWVEVEEPFVPRTRLSIRNGRWHINDQVTYPGSRAEGLLLNTRMVNALFEDRRKPGFDPDANTDRFLAQIPDYAAHGIRAFTLCLQGGMPGYEGALNSAFQPDGSLRESYLARVGRVIEACDRQGLAVILGCFYQRQDQVLADEDAVRRGLTNVIQWLQRCGFRNVLLEIANEFEHAGFDHPILRSNSGQVQLLQLAKRTAPDLLVSTSGLGHGRMADPVAAASDFILIHFNGTLLDDIPARVQALQKHGKPILCNEDDKTGAAAARAAENAVAHGASWGLMLKEVNQYAPFRFQGATDDPVVYTRLKELTAPDIRR